MLIDSDPLSKITPGFFLTAPGCMLIYRYHADINKSIFLCYFLPRIFFDGSFFPSKERDITKGVELVLAIIQARMGSSRLPGKTMADLAGASLISRLLDRVQRSKTVHRIVVATTHDASDNILEKWVREETDHLVFRGSINNVLERFYQCAYKHSADIIVRLTADDPLKDPEIIDLVVNELLDHADLDYSSNIHPPSFPEGLDVEVFRFSALARAFHEAILPSELEHVTPYIWKNTHLFRSSNISHKEDLSGWRLTVDKPADLILQQKIFEILLLKDPHFSYHDVIALLKNRPELLEINKGSKRNEGYLESINRESHEKSRHNF